MDISKTLTDLRALVPAKRDCEYVCFVPSELGLVTRLYVRGGRVVAETESGISMIVANTSNQPVPPKEAA